MWSAKAVGAYQGCSEELPGPRAASASAFTHPKRLSVIRIFVLLYCAPLGMFYCYGYMYILLCI